MAPSSDIGDVDHRALTVDPLRAIDALDCTPTMAKGSADRALRTASRNPIGCLPPLPLPRKTAAAIAPHERRASFIDFTAIAIGLTQRLNSRRRRCLPPGDLSPRSFLAGFVRRTTRSATGQSCASPPLRRMERRRPLASAIAWFFVLRPPRERPIACFCSPLFRLRPSGAP